MKAVLLIMAAALTSGCCTLMGGKTQELQLAGAKGDRKLADGAGAVVLVEGVPVEVDSIYAEAKDAKGLGTMDLWTNANKHYMGYGVTRIKLPRRTLGDHVVLHVYKDGYKTQRFVLDSHLSGTYWLNFFNLIGFAADAFTGTMWSYGPEKLTLKFEKDRRS